MRIDRVLDRDVLIGALAVQSQDARLMRPTEIACTVTALRGDGKAVKQGVQHPSGVNGFLTLRPAAYRLRIEPLDAAFMPSLRSVTVGAGANFVDAPLRTSSVYPPPPASIVLRATLQWRTTRLPVRWALCMGKLATAAAPAAPISTAWTRSNPKGEFALFLAPQGPGSDGIPVPYVGTVDLYADASAIADEHDLSDLPLDDDVGLLTRQSFRRTVTTAATLSPGDDVSLNSDVYPTGAVPPQANTVVLLT